MSDPVFGIVFQQIDEEARPVIGADLSTIGIVGPAADADATVFPLDTPVKIYSNDTLKIAKLGDDGFIADAIRGINDQLGELQFAAQVVVVRTALGVNADPAIANQLTIANIMGDSTAQTGIWAFAKAPSMVAATPRVILAPGYTGQLASGVSLVTVGAAGSGYDPDTPPRVTFSGGGDAESIVQATGHAVVNEDGEVTGVVIDTAGQWYDSAPTIAISSGSGATATATLDDDAVASIAVTAGGTNYVAPPVVSFTGGGGGTGAEAHAVLTGGVVTSIVVDAPGSGYTVAPTVVLTPVGAGATATATIATLANPVVAGAPALLAQLLAHMVAESAGTSQTNDENWRETINSQRIIPLSGGVKVVDPATGAVVVRPFAPRFAGALVRRDHETGAPMHSAANQPIYGIVGPGREIAFTITDGANEGQALLAINMGILVRGEVGSDFAISTGGFIAIATDNAGDDTLWQFYNVTRGRDYIHLSLLRALRPYLGRFNIVGHTVQAILNTIKGFLRDLKADEHILGYNIEFTGDQNSADEIRLGHLTVGFAAEEPPVLTKLTVRSARYRPAIDAMVADLQAQLNLAA